MAIPPFNDNGLLPEGIHDCTLAEAAARFGSFQGSGRRPQLWAKLREFVHEAKASQVIEELLLDGSFVTAKPDPNDIDIVVVVFAEGPLEQIRQLQAQIDEYVRRWEETPA